MTNRDICKIASHSAGDHKPTWNGDNRCFIKSLLPFITLTDEQRRVLVHSYGLQHEGAHSYEMESDGETLVRDKSILGNIRIKNPAGVCHDALNRAPQHYLAGKTWTATAANRIYRELLIVFGYSRVRAWARWLGVTVSVDYWWKGA